MIDRDINSRWERGEPHHPEAERLARTIGKLDDEYAGCFDLSFGGDGDNGETLCYLLSIYFECIDAGEVVFDD